MSGMKKLLLIVLPVVALCLSACNTYESEDGVIIKDKGWFGQQELPAQTEQVG